MRTGDALNSATLKKGTATLRTRVKVGLDAHVCRSVKAVNLFMLLMPNVSQLPTCKLHGIHLYFPNHEEF